MKAIAVLLVLCGAFLCGCASMTIYDDKTGKPLVKIQSNAQQIDVETSSHYTVHITNLDNAAATAAGGAAVASGIATATSGAATIAGTMASSGWLKFLGIGSSAASAAANARMNAPPPKPAALQAH